MKHVDYGVTAGLGTSFGPGPTRFGLDLRYGTSFEDIWGNKDDVKSINQWTTLAASLSH